MSVEDLIERLSAIHPKGYDLSLDRIRRLLARLGNPQERIPPAIHVAGTNGKGSTVAFCRAILEAAGHVVHVHTSPHLVRWHERFRIGHEGGGRIVADAMLEDALQRVADANGGQPITVFELLTAAMFLLFSEQKADFCIVEVGLGGRFDATNVIAAPLASIITSIALDHQMHLGDTVEKIAFEKAGIIKPGRPVTVAPQVDSVVEVIEKVAAGKNAPATIAGRDFTFFEQGGRLVYQDGRGLMDLPLPKLRGRHQLANAATAIAALRHSRYDLPDEVYETAMQTVTWPGRMERLRPGTLTALVPATAEIWIDGGHNPSAGLVIADELAELEERSPMPVVLVTAMLTTKDPTGFFDAFKGLVERVIALPVAHSEAGFSAEQMAGFARTAGFRATTAASPASALAEIAQAYADRPVRIVIAGTLYLVGEVLEANGTIPQ